MALHWLPSGFQQLINCDFLLRTSHLQQHLGPTKICWRSVTGAWHSTCTGCSKKWKGMSCDLVTTSCIILTSFPLYLPLQCQPGPLDQCKEEQDAPSSRLKPSVMFCQLITAGLTLPGQQQRQLLNRKRIPRGLSYEYPFSWTLATGKTPPQVTTASGRGKEPRLYRQIWFSAPPDTWE